MAENSVPTNRSKIVSGIKYAYLLGFFALLAGTFHPFITDTSKENLVYGIIILFIGIAGAILVYKGIRSQKQLILTTSGLALMIISLFLIYQIADRPLLQI